MEDEKKDIPNPNPTFYMTNSDADFVKDMNISDKVVLRFSGTVEAERKPETDDDMIIKTIKFSSLKLAKEKRKI